MFPADGAQEPVGGSRPIMVGDGWYSYKDSSDPDARRGIWPPAKPSRWMEGPETQP